MKYLKLFENHKLQEEYLDIIHNKLKNKSEETIIIASATSFKWWLEHNHPEKLDEYLYRITDGEDLSDTIFDIIDEIYKPLNKSKTENKEDQTIANIIQNLGFKAQMKWWKNKYEK